MFVYTVIMQADVVQAIVVHFLRCLQFVLNSKPVYWVVIGIQFSILTFIYLLKVTLNYSLYVKYLKVKF